MTQRFGRYTTQPPSKWRHAIGGRRSSRRSGGRTVAIPLALAAGFAVGILVASATPVRDVTAAWFSDVADAFTGPSEDSAPTVGNSRPIAPERIHIVDADTVRIDGRPTRLVGFNAPETHEPRCALERELGTRATARVRDLVTTGSLAFAEVDCACAPGTAGTPQCNYGRACGILSSSGRDIGAVLIAEGLAVPFVCGATRCPPTPRPWCDGTG